MKCIRKSHSKISGFTLVELVVCMVILGIASTMVMSFVSNGTEFFVETSVRADISVMARNLSLRIERQIGRALPYSFDVSDDKKSLRFLETVKVTRIQSIQKKADDKYTVSFFSDNKEPFVDMQKRCRVYGVSDDDYRVYPALFNRGGTLSIGDGLRLSDFNWKDDNSQLSFDTNSDYQSLSSGSRIYFLDTCSDVAYLGGSGSLIYSVYKFVPDKAKRVLLAEYSMSGEPIKLKNIRFSTSGTSTSFGLLLMSRDQSVPVSQYVEVENAP